MHDYDTTTCFPIVSLRGEGTGLLSGTMPALTDPHPQAEYSIGDVHLTYCARNRDEFDFLQSDADQLHVALTGC